jgi:hypothetical protein
MPAPGKTFNPVFKDSITSSPSTTASDGDSRYSVTISPMLPLTVLPTSDLPGPRIASVPTAFRAAEINPKAVAFAKASSSDPPRFNTSSYVPAPSRAPPTAPPEMA